MNYIFSCKNKGSHQYKRQLKATFALNFHFATVNRFRPRDLAVKLTVRTWEEAVEELGKFWDTRTNETKDEVADSIKSKFNASGISKYYLFRQQSKLCYSCLHQALCRRRIRKVQHLVQKRFEYSGSW